MKITDKLDGFYYTESPSKKMIRSSGIHTSYPSNRYDDLDIQIKSEVNNWIKTGEYLKHLLIFTNNYQDWNERTIIARIKLALKPFDKMTGRMIITEDSDRIVLAWTNKARL